MRFPLCFAAVTALGALTASAQVPTERASSVPPTTETRQQTSEPPTARDLTPEMRADIMMARKMYREAADIYADGAGKSAVLSNKLGIAYHQMLQFDAARKSYERAIKLNPHYAEAINNLGTIYYAKKKYGRAVNSYKRALKYAPESASIYSNLGTAEFARKHYDLALANYQKALELDPEVFERRSSTGVLLQERSVNERAKFHFFMAKMYAKAGNTERALLYIRKAIEEGFKERQKFTEDPEFAGLRDLPEFQELMKLEPRAL